VSRKDLGHTEAVLLKLHPDLKSWVEARSAVHYCSQAEYIRRLIIADRIAFHGEDPNDSSV
jgi:hypothetical protein